MDNNFFANPEWKQAVAILQQINQPVLFQSGLDVRLLTKEQCLAIQSLKLYKQLHIAWDNPRDNLTDQIELLKQYIPTYRIACYVLIGYWSTLEQDLARVEALRTLKIAPFVMPYNRKEPYQKAFARWVNHKAIFKTVPWNEYKSKTPKQLKKEQTLWQPNYATTAPKHSP
jgi:hypothetical protein